MYCKSIKIIREFRPILVAGFLLLFATYCTGQSSLQLLRYFELPNADPSTDIQMILQDSDGFMWFGSNQGLYKFDGVEYKVYKTEYNNPYTLLDDNIRALYQDKSGRLWIGTKSGIISVLDIATDSLKHYREPINTSGIASNYDISTFYEDANGVIWVGSNGNGLGKYNPSIDAFNYLRNKADENNSLGQDFVSKILPDASGNLFIGLNGYGLDHYLMAKNEFRHYRNSASGNPNIDFRNNVIRDLVAIDGDNLLLAAYGGINRLNLETGAFVNYSMASETPLLTNSFNSIFRVQESYFITSYAGYIYEVTDSTRPPVLAYKVENNIRSSYVDKEQMVWLGLSGGKIAYLIPNSEFGFNSILKENDRVFGLQFINNKLYLGTQKGVYELGPDRAGKYINSTPGILCMEKDKQGRIWFGSDSDGATVLDLVSGQTKVFRFDQGKKTGLRHDTVLDIYCDPYGAIWVSTFSGISRWFPESGTFKTYGTIRANDVLRLNKNELWTATDQGVAIINLKDDSYYMKQSSRENHKDSLLHNQVLSLYSPNNDSVLIGSNRGLNLFIKSRGKMLNIHELLDIPYVAVKNIVQDQHQNYWAVTNKGILQFNLRSKRHKFLDSFDGLDFARTYNGKHLGFDRETTTLFVGGNGGYYQFRPKKTISNSAYLKTQITGFKVLNADYPIPAADEEVVRLSYDKDLVAFNFTGLHYPNPQKVVYYYTLEGLDEQWITTEERSATFANLSPGAYTFKVKASLGEGTATALPTTFTFAINPPIWGTWWAYLIYAFILIWLGFYLVRAFVARERLKTQLHIEHIEVEKVREMSKLRSQFFANVSHEFRTPLTLISGPVKSLMEKNTDPSTQKYLQLIANNTKRLQQLINQLLDYSKVTAKGLPLKKEERDIFAFLRAISSSFVSLAQSKNILYHEAIPIATQHALIDTNKVETILNNLLSNALKFTENGGTVIVTAVTLIKDKHNAVLKISVSDTGIGLSNEDKKLVFHRFYRSMPEVEGIGIGLALTKEMVELLGGTISVEDNSPKGAVFVVELPIELVENRISGNTDTEVNKEKDIVENTTESQSILLVEDNVELQEYIRDLLLPYGQVIQAVNGVAALALATRAVPDLIISDYMMPGMDGGELCRQLRQQEVTSHIPFIMLTAKATDEDKIAGLAVGATDYIFKPFDSAELILKVKNILSERKKLQEQLQIQLFSNKQTKQLPSQDDRFLQRIKELVLEHSNRSDLSVQILSDAIGMSRVQLYRKITAITGMSPSDLIRNFRLQRAAELLEQNWGNVSEIAYEVGFSNLSYFSKSFKAIYKLTPSQFAAKKA
ncbi:hybrid sensor histidine kinase/response regulator transcription factor [Muriicola sp. Z0-33]|uniref:hybrid sensor histidine kinase/response regulator transcription factor n=1 Tax=Muriicola sp. Z0-33 TaxID=2816957 RepID=UPI002237F0C4|nr:hybrid sensor histidine kinase/response regulator transcription factor [Muriicola sp. Z0-33]MCW5514755.1 response regulator [Muriicola sp. Z0-33]